MANKLGLISAGLAVASGAMMTFIITTETFAVATLGGNDACELGTLGVFTSSYTPDCDPDKPGDPFSGDTLEFWPLFSSQNAFGGAFASLGVPAQEELPEGWPAEEYDCEAGVNGYLDLLAKGTEDLWATVDNELQGVFFTLLQSDPEKVETKLDARLKEAVIGVAAGTYSAVISTQVANTTIDPKDETATITPTEKGVLDATPASLGCPVASTDPNANTCFYLDEFSCAVGDVWKTCLEAIASSIIDVDFNQMFGGGYGPLLGASRVAGVIKQSDPVAGLTVEAGFGLLNACYKFGFANFGACLAGAVPQSVNPGATGIAGLPANLNEPHILGCLFKGLNTTDPLQGIPPGVSASEPAGRGCIGLNAGPDASYATTYEVFQRISVKEILPLAPPGKEASVAQLGTFGAIMSGCADFYDTLVGVQASGTELESCKVIVGDHFDGLNATEDPTHNVLKNGGGCIGAIPELAKKSTCIDSTARWAVPKQVIEGVYTIDPPTKLYTFETVFKSSKSKSEQNKKLIADPAIAKCKDDNEDAQAIEKAQKLTPVGVALTFVGAVAGLVVAAMGGKVPKLAPLVPAVIVLTGAVIFMVALLAVRNAPVYELVGQPCPDGNTCYSAGTGNKMALPAILIALISGVGLVVSVFLGGSGEDYSSFKETQVGMKA